MRARHRRLLAYAAVLCAAIAFTAASQGPEQHHVAGEKLDSGLAQLPHYRDWAKYPETRQLVVRPNRVAGEKLDSGLGDLKHYRHWADNTGRVREAVEVASRH